MSAGRYVMLTAAILHGGVTVIAQSPLFTSRVLMRGLPIRTNAGRSNSGSNRSCATTEPQVG